MCSLNREVVVRSALGFDILILSFIGFNERVYRA